MRIYIAAPWDHKAEACAAATQLEAAGHTITKKWWEHPEVAGFLRNDDDNDELAIQAVEDISGVWNANVFLLLNMAPSEGKCVETGLALAYGTPIIIIGQRSNLFHYLPGIPIVPDVATAIAYISDMDI